MLIWINGMFGVGKTQTANELRQRLPGSTIADPELPGIGVQRMYPVTLRSDFQESEWWAPLITTVLVDLAERHPGPILVPMTITDRRLMDSIVGGLRGAGHDVRHVTLLAARETIAGRLRKRLDGPKSWAAQQFDTRAALLEDPAFATHIDTTGRSIANVAEAVAGETGLQLGPRERNPLRSARRRAAGWSAALRG
jgi:hypothetical protein